MAFDFFRTAGLASVWLVLITAMPVQAQQPAVRFDINGFAVEGSPLLRSEDFSRIVAPYIGKQKTAADVQKAQQALQQAYLDLGYCSVQVTVPKAEPDAGTVTLKLVASATPISKDCLPMVVLDKGAPPVPVAPGEVAVRPLGSAAQAAAEAPPPAVEAPSRIARAPLKPLQDRPPAPKPITQAQPEIASSPAPTDTPENVTVQSLAQAPVQPALIVTPAVSGQVETPVVTTPAPVAPPVQIAKPAPAVPAVATAQPAPKAEVPSPVVVAPAAPSVAPVAPPIPAPSTPAITSTPAQELAQAPRPQPAVPSATAPSVPQPMLEKPADVVASPVKSEPVVPPPTVATETPKPSPPPTTVAVAPRIESPAAPKPQPQAALPQEPIAAKPPVADRPVASAIERPAEKPAAEVIAAAPPQTQTVTPVPAPRETLVEPPKPAAPVPQAIAEAPQQQEKATTAPVTPPAPVIAEPPKPATPVPQAVAEAPKQPEPATTAAVTPPAPTVIEPPKPAAPVSQAVAEAPKPQEAATTVAVIPPAPVVAEPPKPAAPAPQAVAEAPLKQQEVTTTAAVAPPAPVVAESPKPAAPVPQVVAEAQKQPEATTAAVIPPVPVVAEPTKPVVPTPAAAVVAPTEQIAKPASAPPPVAPESVKKPVTEIASAPVTPTPALPIASVEPAKPTAPTPAIAMAPEREAPRAVQPPAELPKETTVVKPESAAPAMAAAPSPVEKPVTEKLTAAPAKPEPVTPVPAPAVAVTEPPPSLPPTPKPAAEAPKEQSVQKPVVAMREADKPAPEVTVAPPVKPAVTPAPSVAMVEPSKPPVEPQVQPPALQPQPPAVASREPVAATPAPAVAAVVTPQAEKPVDKPAAPEVEVRPLAGAVAAAPEPREPAKPAVERAPVRPLQDRQPPATQEQATRVAEASEAKPPAVKPPAVVVQAPAVTAPTEPAAPVEATAGPAALKFDVDRYLVEGNTLLSSSAIGKVLEPYTGKQKDFADVQRALEALQVEYQKWGWGVVQVTLPEQELERGEVRFEVIETRIGKVEVQGNEYFSEANIRRSVPGLKEGETPNSLAMARSLRVANENPVKQSQVSLKAGSNEGEVDATIKVVDDNPRKYSLSFDNTGTSSTGAYRLGVGFQHSNLWDRDHQLTFQYITNPEHPSIVTVFGAGYHIPLYSRGDSIDFVLGYSDVNSGTVQQLFSVSGAGFIVLGRYNMNLNRIGDYEHKVTFGLDYKAFQNQVLTTSGVPLVPDITLHPVSIAYSGEYKNDQNALNFYTSFSYNPFEGGNDAAQSDFKASRGSDGGASAEYSIWRAGLSYQRLLPADWSVRVVANAQTTRNALVAGEQFGVGGANSVRGFNERTYSNDKGHQATFELITPDVAGKIGFNGGRLRFLAFYDTANLSRNFIQPGEQTGLGIDSVGIGLRMTFRERLSMRLDYAQVLHDGGMDAGLPNGRRNSNTLHASALLVY